VISEGPRRLYPQRFLPLKLYFLSFNLSHVLKAVTAIALRSTRVGDSKIILNAWSPQTGRLSLIMPSNSSAESRRRRALTMPMSFFEGVVDVRPTTDLWTISDLRAMSPATSLSANPVKAGVAMFLAEVLSIVLRDTGPDVTLWEFLRHSVIFLDRASRRETTLFPHLFLFKLGQFLGVMPDTSTWGRRRVFDMVDAIFRDSPPVHGRYIDDRRARLIPMMERMTYGDGARLRLTRPARRELLDMIIDYYTLHNLPLGKLQTLSVLREA
jgi:DNA repair protein RecO (recombination protein O)